MSRQKGKEFYGHNDTIVYRACRYCCRCAGLSGCHQQQPPQQAFFKLDHQLMGNLPKREYDYGELEHIAKYFQATKQEEFTIDDITWNDLDMDSVFCMMNQCRSSSGDDYLYKLLRTPLTSKKELEERNRIISFFQRNEKTRIAYQMELSR